jgi:YbbR domain-containing protein
MLHRNLEWKLAALFMAIVLWSYVTVTARIGEKSVAAPVEITGVPANLALVSPPVRAIVLLRGSKESLEGATDQVQAIANITSPHAGRNRATVEITQAAELTVVRKVPAEVTVLLESLKTRHLPITCQLEGEPSPGYILSKPQLSPSHARVKGPESAINRINQLVVKIDTSYALLGQPQSGVVAALDGAGRRVPAVKIDPQTVIVTVPVQSTIASELAPVFVPLQGNPRDGYQVCRITVTPPLITVAGEAGKIKNIPSVSTLPLSLEQASKTFSRRLSIIAPEGAASLSERNVLVKVEIAATPPLPVKPGAE